ncbi:Hypothetical protein CINCED_3A010240 [Cinara cedri]|uniref:adenylate cyclase n=1 Tax=Cinara cedri TaxID=506608 RepID=A0A5E4M4C6_9HEMI|nr:Hypothetical protein CINCED_3A010240 [Cinara cedri]
MATDLHTTEAIGRRGILNGLVTAATKTWRHGQHNGHTSNAVVFPTITTAINTSPACRTPTTNSISVMEEQRRRLELQQNQDRRLNVLWYGGDDIHQQQQQTTLLFESHHNRSHQPTTDDWEKQPLRKQRKSEQSRRQRNLENRRPTEPIVWATILHTIYAASMAAVYYTFDITSGSGWIWMRGILNNSDSHLQRWLCHFSPAWYYVAQSCCAFTIGCLWYRWFFQRQQQQLQHRWWCYVLLVLFTTALLPSVPLVEVFSGKISTTAKTAPLLENLTAKQVTSHSDTVGNLHDNHLILYEGLWQIMFFIFIAYCFVLPIPDNVKSYNKINIDHRNNNTKNFQENDAKDNVTKAVLLFTVGISFAYTALNAYTAYCWYYHHYSQQNNLMEPIKQQLVANVVALICINLTGWLLRQHVVFVRLDIGDFYDIDKFNQKNNALHLALRLQAEKFNRLLTSLVPKRVFLEMKNDILADAARSYYYYSNSNDKDYKHELHLQMPQDMQLLIPMNPKMYLKEYENVSVVYAKMSGFWYNTLPVVCHGGASSQSSRQVITLIDQLFVNLFNGLAHRNHCLPICLLGQRIVFVAGLPAEESYINDDDAYDNSKWKDTRHAKDAIQMGLDLINAINKVVHDVSRSRYGHKIDLNIRVGIHSGRVTCGVLGFTGGLSTHSNLGSRWKYDIWGHDVQVTSSVESSGRPGRVHVSQTTVDWVAKNGVIANSVINQHPPRCNFHNDTVNYNPEPNVNKEDYTFECNEELRDQFLLQNHINTYFVVPDVICTNSEIKEYQNQVRNHGYNDENYSGEDTNIVSLILQSVEHQLQAEKTHRCQYLTVNSSQEIKMTSEHLLSTTTGVVDLPITTAALITAPVTAMMIMNRHRRSKYEQEPLQSVTTIPNTCSTVKTTMVPSSRWEDDVFKNYDHNFTNVSADNDLFRLAIAHLLLLCVVIALFVVNMTTMPWTLLLGITFIIPFVIISGELIYVMALLIDWIPLPKVHSNTYTTAIITDDNDYYQHYDSDHYSDNSYSSHSSVGCLRHIIDCCCPNRCLLLTWFFKPFQWLNNSIITTENTLDDNNSRRWWFIPSFCHSDHRWPTWCLNNNSRSSWISSDESDIENRPGFRNENAILASTSGLSSSQHLQNRLQHSQTININRRSHKTSSRNKRRPKRNYQDEMRCTGFFWLSACCEMFVVLLVCLLALLNAFTCEPVIITATDHTFNESISGFHTPSVNSSRQQQHHSPLTCQWPQYAIITCCLACLSIAIAFPIYYGSLPTLWMKFIVLFFMICVFPITFIHFTHRHIFMAASVMSVSSACCDTNTCQEHIGDEQLQAQNRELQQQSGNLMIVTATMYVIIFTIAILIYSIYTHYLKNRQANLKVKIDRDMRRLNVLRVAHRRTLHTIIPDHVADLLRKTYSGDANDSDEGCNDTWNKQSRITNSQPEPIVVNNCQSEEHIQTHMFSPLYHRNYQSIVVIFASIIREQFLFTTTTSSELNECRSDQHHQQLLSLHEIFIEFDRLLENEKFRGLVEKIKMVGTNTYMAVVGLQRPEHLLLMQKEEVRQRIKRVNCSMDNNTSDRDNEFGLCDVTSANYVIFALDFVREMRRALHQLQTAPIKSDYHLHLRPTQFTLRVGLNVGPAIAGLIGCNDEIWKRPQFDIWGSTVNTARQMDTTGLPGSTQVTNCVVEVMKSVKDSEYEFEIRTQTLHKDYKRRTYFVREHFQRHEGHQYMTQQQQQISNYYQQQHRRIAMGQKTYHHLPTDSNQQQWFKNQTAVQPTPHNNIHRTIKQQSECDQPSSPLIQHTQHSYYAKAPQEVRYKCVEPQNSPPPPPSRSTPPSNMRRKQQSQHYPMPQQQCNEEGDWHSDQLKRSRAASIQLSNDNKQQYYPIRRTPDANPKPITTYARPLQQQKNNPHTSPSGSTQPVPHGLVLLFGDDSQQPSSSSKNEPTITNIVKSNKFISSHAAASATTRHVQQQLSQPRRPNILALRNTTAGAPAITPKKFDADRPLPAPPRSSDTVAGRQRNHHDPRRRRRPHNQPSTTPTTKELQNPVSPDIINTGLDPVAWISSSAFRSPISAETFVSTSSIASSLSSSGSTDAGGTTTSNNNYNTTTTASSSDNDDSYGRTATEDGGGIDRVDIEEFDTATSSVALSPVHQQQHLLLRQWSPSTTTANSSPVRRSSSFRSPLSGGDITVASSSSLRSPPIVGNSTSTGFGGTQSLNRRRKCSSNGTSGVGGSSSSRRRRRRQQLPQNHAPTIAGRSSSPSSAAPEIMTIAATSDRYETPPLSPWKKQQRRQICKDQGTSCAAPGPDFTDEIRRILLLDKHTGDLNDDKKKIVGEVVEQLSLEKHGSIAVGTTVKSPKLDKYDDESNQKNEKNIEIEKPIVTTIPMTTTTNVSSASSFEERERQITEQVKRQQAEVRRILQEHKNNVVSVVRGGAAITTEVAIHRHQKRVTATTEEFSEWSDDESVDPLSALMDNSYREQCIEFTKNANDFEVNRSLVTANTDYTVGVDCDGYTTGGDGDGYTTTGYTTDEAAATADTGMEIVYATAADSSITSIAQHLDDNLSTMNDTGLTDAEGLNIFHNLIKFSLNFYS